MALDPDPRPVAKRKKKRKPALPVRGEQSYGTPKTPTKPKPRLPVRKPGVREEQLSGRPIPTLTAQGIEKQLRYMAWLRREIERDTRRSLYSLGSNPRQVEAALAGRLRPTQYGRPLPGWTVPSAPNGDPSWFDTAAKAILTALGGDLPTQEKLGQRHPGEAGVAQVLRTAAATGEAVIGPDTLRMLRGEHYDPAMVGIELSTIFSGPIKFAAGASRGTRALLAGRGLREAGQVARAAHANPNVLPRVAQRTFQVGDLDVRIPAALSRTGRVAERISDRALRPALSKATGGKILSEVGKAGEEINRSIRYRQKEYTALGNMLRRSEARLSDAEVTAVRLSMQQTTPDEVVDFYKRMVVQALESGDKASVTYLQRHMQLALDAGPMLEQTPEGMLRLSTRAGKKAHAHEGLARKVAAKREELYVEGIGRLTAEQVAERAIAAARVTKGAEWDTYRNVLQQILDADPSRQEFFRAVDELVPNAKANKALKQTFDAQIMSIARRKYDNPMAVQVPLARISQVRVDDEIRGMLLGDLYDSVPERPALPERIDSRGIAERVIGLQLPLPPELRGVDELAAAIDNVYARAVEGAAFKDWYARAGNMARVIAGQENVTPDQAAQLLAIYSQASDTVANVKFVIDAIRQFKETGAVSTIGRFPKRQAQEATNVLKGGEWKGRKRSSFYMNIVEEADPAAAREVDAGPVTVDRWVMRMFAPGMNRDVPGSSYDAIEKVVQEMAAQVGWRPKEVQAAAWVAVKAESLRGRYPRWGPERVQQEAGDAFEKGFEYHGAQQRLFGGGVEEQPGWMAEGIPPARKVPPGSKLEGLPDVNGKGRPSADVQRIAEDYMDEAGIPYDPPRQYAKVDEDRARKIADEYDRMKHDPLDPEVHAQYVAMINETMAQYEALTRAGYVFEFHPSGGEGYASPWDAMADLRDNKHLYVFPTEAGFGTGDLGDNPLLLDSGIQWGGQKVTYNDIFRGVHDTFGHHKEGVGFRWDGEENAWRQHSAMYSDEARGAMTSETRGQNSWVNFGPHGAANRTANQADTVYAEQKAGLMPRWTWDDGAHDVRVYKGENASKAYDELLHKAAKQFLGAKAKRLGPRQRQQAEEFLSNWADENPEEPMAKLFNDLQTEAFATRQTPDPDSPEFAERYFDRESFHEAAAEELQAYEELARDVARTLPEEEWPAWVTNQIRRQAVGPEEPVRLPEPDTLLQASWAEGEPPAIQSFNYYRDLLAESDPAVLAALTERPTPQTIVRAANAAINSNDVTAAKKLIDEIQRLHDNGWNPGGKFSKASEGMEGARGAIEFWRNKATNAEGAIIRFSRKDAEVSTFVHEVAHFVRHFGMTDHEQEQVARWAGAEPIGELGPFGKPEHGWRWTEEAEEKFARGLERWVMQAEGPEGLKSAFTSLARIMRHTYEKHGINVSTDFPDVPGHVAKVFRGLYKAGKPPRGGRLWGFSELNRPGAVRVPLERGIPITANTRAVRSFLTTNARLFGAGRRQAIGGGPADKALEKAYKGRLLMSGFHKVRWADAMAKDLVIAGRLSAAHHARKALLQAGQELPQRVDDIAMKVNPKKAVSPELQAVFDKMESLDDAGLTLDDVRDLQAEFAERAQRELFPDMLETADGAILDVRQVAADAIRYQEPIDNIVWVPREFLEESGVMYTPKPKRKGRGRIPIEITSVALDTLNDVQRVAILYLNPAYIPMNIAGNAVMNLFQQGLFLPKNLYKAAAMHRDLDYFTRSHIDAIMGNGLTGSLMGKTAMMQGVNSTLGHWIQVATDTIPRRAAFLHEAARLGYKTEDDLKRLMSEWSDDLDIIARRANDAIVDFDRLGPFEREVLARYIFVYPWLKGASRYTMRFILDHPMQAAALTILGEHAYHTSNEQLGDRPFYAETVVPFSTEAVGANIPGVGRVSLADVVGDHSWTTEREINGQVVKLPMAFDVRQLLTFTTPLDLVRASVAFVKGDRDAPQAVEMVVPAIGALITAATGYDTFKQREVPVGAGTFVKELTNIPLKDRFERIFMSDEERADYQEVALRPRTRSEEIQRAVGGSVAPAPFNVERSEEIRREKLTAYDRNRLELVEDSKRLGLGDPPREVLRDMEVYYNLEKDLKTGMTQKEKAEVATRYWDQVYGGNDMTSLLGDLSSEAEYRALYEQLRPGLYPWYTQWKRELDKLRQAESG